MNSLRPVNLPQNGLGLLASDKKFAEKIDYLIKKAKAKKLWQETEEVPIQLEDFNFWAYWLYKTATPIERPKKNSGLEKHFSSFRKNIFDLKIEGFEEEDCISVSFSGDLMATKGLSNSQNTLYKNVSDLIFDADFSYANLESTLTNQPIVPLEFSMTDTPMINLTPEEYRALIQHKNCKFDLVQLANNHILDCGEEGVLLTLDYLRNDKISQIGVNETAEDQLKPSITEIKGMRIGWVAHTFMVNFKPYPDDKPYFVNMTPFHMEKDPDISLIKKQIKLCRSEGCDFVIAALHWGLEFEFYPHPDQLKWAYSFAECGADMIVGHHPHVPQFTEIYKTKCNPQKTVPIIYSLGNLTPVFSHPATAISLIARLHLSKGKFEGNRCVVPKRIELIPVATLQKGLSEKASIGIYRLSKLMSDEYGEFHEEFGSYISDMAYYTDLVIGPNWRFE